MTVKMNFIADLHIHSRFSMATSKTLTVQSLAGWAACKGIDVLGCGDFTHPRWREELRENLVYDEESGFYRLKGRAEWPDALAGRSLAASLGERPRSGPLFCLQTEISSIYRRGGKTRKVHNLVFMPTLEDADRLSERLALVGNINSDGRPILGLDSRDLLEIVLECSPLGVLVPAHIWTPWFALFGSKSGFDSIEECYGDLTGHIFALETGLSSDPAMNRHWSALDGYTLISNSDAHSGANLGREANFFEGAPSYAGMFGALRAAAGLAGDAACRFLGTMEFYPEEGKYHLDGHRACGVHLEPAETRKLANICPVCGKPLTIGVLHRVMELADRQAPAELPDGPEARMLVPLAEVLGEILGVGPGSRRVMEAYARCLAGLGPELDILCNIPVSRVEAFWEPLGEAVARTRKGQVLIQPGFDGQYGVIRVFEPLEAASLRAGGKGRQTLPSIERQAGKPAPKRERALFPDVCPEIHMSKTRPGSQMACSPEQLEAVTASAPALALAGPGAGKTRVLVARMAHLLQSGHSPAELLALTFTRRAAGELRERVAAVFPEMALPPRCDTLHGLAYGLLREYEAGGPGLAQTFLLADGAAKRLFRVANSHLPKKECDRLWSCLAIAREKKQVPADELAQAAARYARAKSGGGHAIYVDYADLLEWLLEHAGEYRGRWLHILVDEVQDLSPMQLAVLKALLPESGAGFFGIGDPDQAIYEFRGAGGQSLDDFLAIWPDLRVLRLSRSYRASQDILDMAQAALNGKGQCGVLRAVRPVKADLRVFAVKDENAEASWVAGKIKELLGSTAHTLLDAASRDSGLLDMNLAPGDIAVLTRIKAQIPPLARALEQAGIPCVAPGGEEFWDDEMCASFLEIARESWPDCAPEKFLAALEAGAIAGDSAHIPDAALLRGSAPFASLCRMWAECGGWENFFQRLAWAHEAELIRSRAQSVQLITLHASKGLEFQVVFLPGLEDGLLPLRRELLFGDNDATENLAAENRLLYVGLTRAARGIFISRCQRRRLFGKSLELNPSPYLQLIGSFCRRGRMAPRRRLCEKELSLFPDLSGSGKKQP